LQNRAHDERASTDQALEVGLRELWTSWKAFSQGKEIDKEVIGNSPLYFDFLSLVKKMRTPIGISKRSEMETIRMAAHAAIEDVGKLQRAVTTALMEINIRVEESEETCSSINLTDAFLSLPELETPALGS
jgi:hypothetical protein